MGQGIILMVPVTSIQKWDTGFSGGILNFESWYPSWIPRKNINFTQKMRAQKIAAQKMINNNITKSIWH
jgi:hypothetical protein